MCTHDVTCSLAPVLPPQVYRPIAARGSSMYFLIRDLSALNHMYQTSLSMFLQLFKRALASVSVLSSET